MNIRTQFINEFTIDSFHFRGAWVFSNRNRFFMLSQHGTSIILDKLLFESLIKKEISDELSFKLVSHGFADVPSLSKFVSVTDIRPTFFIIDLTTNCNLHCLYCFRDYKQRGTSIVPQKIEEICDYIFSYCKKHNISHFHIQPWGGEPLMELNKIAYIQDFFSCKKMYPNISIETNATLITKEIAKELYSRKISIGVSIDGDEFIHNIQRPYNTGRGSFPEVMRGIQNLKEVGYNSFGTISVVTSKSIDNIESIIDKLVRNFNIYNLKFNLVRVEKDSNLAIPIEKINPYIERLFYKMISLVEEEFPATEGNIVERIYNLLVRQERNICKSRGCMGGRKMVSFDKNGYIYPCEMTDCKEEAIGCITNSEDLIEVVKSAILSKDYFREYRVDECSQCPWWYYCRGGCHAAIKYKENSYLGIDEVECAINKKLYPLIIETILNRPSIIEKLTYGKIKINCQ